MVDMISGVASIDVRILLPVLFASTEVAVFFPRVFVCLYIGHVLRDWGFY